MSDNKPYIGISSCLLGEKVKYDGQHNKNSYLLNILQPYAEFLPCCPEVAIGLGVPRPTIKLIGDPNAPRLVFVSDESKDITSAMQTFADKKVKQLKKLDGYIFKKNSPSCGVSKVKVYQGHAKPPKMGTGIFAKTLMAQYPHLPVEDEGRLNDYRLRENFIARVFLYQRLKGLIKNPSKKAIVSFHAAHKFALMAHSTEAYKKIGQSVSNLKGKNLKQFAQDYADAMMSAFKLIATCRKNTNVLQHIYGYLKKLLSETDKQEMCDVIEEYRLGLVPLIVPITLLRHHINHHHLDYIRDQIYIYPYPNELMLRNMI